MTEVEVTVQLACDDAGVPAAGQMRDWIGQTLATVAGGEACRGEITVRVVDEDEGRALNHRYRGADQPTNVLSFPAAAGDDLAVIDAGMRPLGDLVLCAPVVAREAAEQGKRPASHWGHLLVHGTLHLLGYDHQNGPAAREMEALEIRILARLGVDDPYRHRDTA